MSCPKCSGLCILDTERTEDCHELEQWRCINCGYYTEPVMEQNRRMQLEEA